MCDDCSDNDSGDDSGPTPRHNRGGDTFAVHCLLPRIKDLEAKQKDREHWLRVYVLNRSIFGNLGLLAIGVAAVVAVVHLNVAHKLADRANSRVDELLKELDDAVRQVDVAVAAAEAAAVRVDNAEKQAEAYERLLPRMRALDLSDVEDIIKVLERDDVVDQLVVLGESLSTASFAVGLPSPGELADNGHWTLEIPLEDANDTFKVVEATITGSQPGDVFLAEFAGSAASSEFYYFIKAQLSGGAGDSVEVLGGNGWHVHSPPGDRVVIRSSADINAANVAFKAQQQNGSDDDDTTENPRRKLGVASSGLEYGLVLEEGSGWRSVHASQLFRIRETGGSITFQLLVFRSDVSGEITLANPRLIVTRVASGRLTSRLPPRGGPAPSTRPGE